MNVSVIIPVYNVKAYLEKCLDSVVNQTLKFSEVIVIDDGSTDGCSAIVDRYASLYSNIKAIHKENGGLMSAWMRGIKECNGDYVCFLDSDDYLELTFLERLVTNAEIFKADITMCNVYYDRSLIGGRQKCYHNNFVKPGLYNGDDMNYIRESIFPKLGRDYLSPSRWAKLIKKELILQNLKYCDTSINSAEDVNIMVPTMMDCQSFYYFDESLLYYVQRPASISHKFQPSAHEKYNLLITLLTKAIEEKQLCELQPFIIGMYNLYAVAWTIYVFNSNLSYSEKKKQIERLTVNENYISSEKLINSNDGATALLYKLYMKTHCFPLYYCSFIMMRKIQSLKK